MEKVLGGSENDHIKGRIIPLCATCWETIQVTKLLTQVCMCYDVYTGGGAEQMCFTPSLTSERAALIEGPGPRGLYSSLDVDCPHSLTHTHTH